MSIKLIEQVVDLTNIERAKEGLQPLKLNDRLLDAAQDHSNDMARNDFFNHTGADGLTVGDRVRASGYQYSTAGENIAAGQTTAAQVVEGWMNSPGHRANILNPNYTEIGVGYEYLQNDTGSVNHNHYWTQVFGTLLSNNNTNSEIMTTDKKKYDFKQELDSSSDREPNQYDISKDEISPSELFELIDNLISSNYQDVLENLDDIDFDSSKNSYLTQISDKDDSSSSSYSFEKSSDSSEAEFMMEESESSEEIENSEDTDIYSPSNAGIPIENSNLPTDTESESSEEIENFEDTDIYSPSNAGIPIENSNLPAGVDDGNDINKLDFISKYANPNGNGNDRYFGTGGVNNFEFNPLLNAKPEIYEKHTDDDNKINWKAVAGENDNYHDHWVDSIGQDVIMDFSGSGGDGDKITIKGHTVAVTPIEESDDRIKLGIYSDQGADGSRGNGAHDFDVLGTITVNHDGNFNYNNDVSTVTNNVFDGAFEYA